jgi:hypothetical protein
LKFASARLINRKSAVTEQNELKTIAESVRELSEVVQALSVWNLQCVRQLEGLLASLQQSKLLSQQACGLDTPAQSHLRAMPTMPGEHS